MMCLLMQCIVFSLFYNSLGVCGKPPRTNYIHLISRDKCNLILSFFKSEGKCDIPVKERTRQYRSMHVYYWRHKDKLTLGMSFICFFEFVYSMLLRVWFAWYICDFWCNMPNWISFGVPLIIYCPDSNWIIYKNLLSFALSFAYYLLYILKGCRKKKFYKKVF